MIRTIVARGGNTLKKAKSIRISIRNISNEYLKRRHTCRTLLIRSNTPTLQWHLATPLRLYSSDFPAHIKVQLPALSPTMETGTIISWSKKEGDKLNEGDLLAEIETDKATMGFETPEEGYLAKILVPEGTKNIPVGKLVCIIVENEKDVAAFKDFKDDSPAEAPKAAAPAPSAPTPAPPPPAVPAPAPAAAPPTQAAAHGGRVSPMATRLAEIRDSRLGTPSSAAAGAAAAPVSVPAAAPVSVPAGAAYVDIPVSGIRATIAKRLLESKQYVPHYYLTVELNVDKLMKLRSRFNKKLEKEGVKLSLNDFVIKAVALASRKVPEANSAWLESDIRQYGAVDVSVAVSTDRGLITPIVFGADSKNVTEISRNVKELAAKARDGKLQPQEFQGGTISVSNLGMFGITNFSAIINPPQSCILAVGTTSTRMVADDSEKGLRPASFMQVTLSSDHRVVDGAVGAEWLKAFRQYIEDPESMII